MKRWVSGCLAGILVLGILSLRGPAAAEEWPGYDRVEKLEPGCEDGYLEHYRDEEGNLYREEEGKLVPAEPEEIRIPALGHLWSEPQYTWAEDGSSCTARRICGRDSGHSETARAEVRAETVQKPTEKEMGITRYTASFREDWAAGGAGPLELRDIPMLEKPGQTEPPETTGETDPPETTKETDPPETTEASETTGPSGETEPVGTTVPGEPEKHVHELVHIPGRAPTCLEDGAAEYWYCPACDRRFSDAEGKKPLGDVLLPHLGHDWVITYEWQGHSCTARRVCSRGCGEAEETTAEARSYHTVLPTCLEGGRWALLAEFPESWAQAQLLEKPENALGHSWEKTTYHWAEDGSSCTAQRVCSRDGEHCETAQGEIEMLPGERPGQLVRTARFSQDWALPDVFIPGQTETVPETTVPETEPELAAAALLTEDGRFRLPQQPSVITAAQLRTLGSAAPSEDRTFCVDCGGCRITYDWQAIQYLLKQTEGCQKLELLAESRDLRAPDLTEAQYRTLSRNWKEGSLWHTSLLMYRDGTVQSLETLEGRADLRISRNVPRTAELRGWRVDPDGSLQEVPVTVDRSQDTVTLQTGSHGYYLIKTRVHPIAWAVLAVFLAGLAAGAVWFGYRKFYSVH